MLLDNVEWTSAVQPLPSSSSRGSLRSPDCHLLCPACAQLPPLEARWLPPAARVFFWGGGVSLVWECFDATDVEFVSYFTESRQDSLWGLLRDLESETDMRSRRRGLVSFPAQ